VPCLCFFPSGLRLIMFSSIGAAEGEGHQVSYNSRNRHAHSFAVLGEDHVCIYKPSHDGSLSSTAGYHPQSRKPAFRTRRDLLPWLLFLSLLAGYALVQGRPQELRIALAALDGMTLWASNSQRLLCNLRRYGDVMLKPSLDTSFFAWVRW